MAKKAEQKPKDHGIANVAAVPVRRKPEDQAEMVTQILFGETFYVTQRKNKSWIKIKCQWDDYEGWIDPKQIHYLSEEEFQYYTESVAVSIDLCQNLINESISFPILAGSSLPYFDGMSFKMPDGKYVFNGQAIMQISENNSIELLSKVAKKFINAPYLWGGRSPFGIDCSGFMQIIFKAIGVNLPRDAWQQAEIGQLIDFTELALEGDLAFFVNAEDKIIHVGLVLVDSQIIHASGKVRIDRLDHEGIFNTNTKKYSHKLKYIKRIIEI